MKTDGDKLPIVIAGMMVKDYFCAQCGEKITGFKDRLSAQEFRVTHQCQKCQDKLWDKLPA